MGVIPVPVLQQQQEGEYILKSPCSVAYDGEGLVWVAQYLTDTLKNNLGLEVSAEPFDPSSGFGITLTLGASLEVLGDSRHLDEGYKLEVDSTSGVSIQGITSRGVFYGVQTLLQLLPARRSNPEQMEFSLECTQIFDAPRFKWRGVLLDVGRHFYGVPYIKRLLDLMAMHKMNVFHWHLTEDQGWRLEIKALPRLTDFGAWRKNGDDKYGGFYSQEEVREVVAYAALRGVDVMPEVELPGHCCAALASYTELSCTEQVREVPYQWGIHEDVYCAGKEAVFQFLDKVFKEVAELFPFEYVHIGGDECPKVRWEGCSHCQQRIQKEKLESESQLQSWFIQRAGKMLAEYNKKIVGWDEILEGGLPEGATVMSWRGVAGGIIAAKHGQDVIMTPTSYCYFDYKQSNSPEEPGAWYACLPLHMVYLFDPIPAPFQPVPQMLPTLPTATPALLAPPAMTAAAEEATSTAASDPMDVEVEASKPNACGSSPACHQSKEEVRSPPNTPVSSFAPVLSTSTEDADTPEGSIQKQEGVHGSWSEENPRKSAAAPLPSPPPSLPLILPHMPVALPACPGPLPRSPTKVSDCNLTTDEQRHILGGQANLWTEYVGDENTAEYMLLPRLCALAETLWSPKQSRDWNSFLERLKGQMQRFDTLGYRYRPLGFN